MAYPATISTDSTHTWALLPVTEALEQRNGALMAAVPERRTRAPTVRPGEAHFPDWTV